MGKEVHAVIQSNRLMDRFIELTKIDSPSLHERGMTDRLIRELKNPGCSVREDNFTVAEEPYDCGSEVFDYTGIQSKEAYVLDFSGAIAAAADAISRLQMGRLDPETTLNIGTITGERRVILCLNVVS